ncbi:SNAP29 [Cordylochernes scorpioides]|uniref:SNAP29 n=1 Tax=Cordylochernes scorpioides TaxID=51811 RepID=A0ABY6LA98_9ARAC|nr:SNAP29 [Cordylochernes scorpioides]
MAGELASRNPMANFRGISFDDDEDDDEADVIPNVPKYTVTSWMPDLTQPGPSRDPVNAEELRRKELLEKKLEIQKKTLQGTSTSLGLLYESEQVGIKTAEDLVRQREQLENVDEKLDDINTSMKISHKHIAAMKSFFGSLKSYMKRGGSDISIVSADKKDKSKPERSKLRSKVEEVTSKPPTSSKKHPALRAKDIDTSAQSPDKCSAISNVH